MLFTILISIVFIAEVIIAVALIRAILRLDKAICEVNDLSYTEYIKTASV